MEDKLLRIEKALEVVGSRNDRKLKKYSDNFNKMFEFYFRVYRTGVINFCGSNFVVDSVKNGSDARKDPNYVIERWIIDKVDLPPLSKIENKVETIVWGLDPVMKSPVF